MALRTLIPTLTSAPADGRFPPQPSCHRLQEVIRQHAPLSVGVTHAHCDNRAAGPGQASDPRRRLQREFRRPRRARSTSDDESKPSRSDPFRCGAHGGNIRCRPGHDRHHRRHGQRHERRRARRHRHHSRGQSKNTSDTYVTDETGSYTAPFLTPGTYAVEVHVQGFKKWVRDGVILQVNQRARVDVALEVGGFEETTTVGPRRRCCGRIRRKSARSSKSGRSRSCR